MNQGLFNRSLACPAQISGLGVEMDFGKMVLHRILYGKLG